MRMRCTRRTPKRHADRTPPILQRYLVGREEACIRRKSAPSVAISLRHSGQHRLTGADREFEGWRQSLSHALQLAEFIKDDEIAHRYLLEYGPAGACDARRIEMA